MEQVRCATSKYVASSMIVRLVIMHLVASYYTLQPMVRVRATHHLVGVCNTTLQHHPPFSMHEMHAPDTKSRCRSNMVRRSKLALYMLAMGRVWAAHAI